MPGRKPAKKTKGGAVNAFLTFKDSDLTGSAASLNPSPGDVNGLNFGKK